MSEKQRNDESESYCPIPHADDRPRRSSRESVICAGHVAKLSRTLTELSTFDADADQHSYDGKLARHDGAPLTGSGEKPLPIDSRKTYDWERVTIADAPRTLAGWCRTVAEERHLSPPHLMEPAVPILGPLCTGCGHGSCRQIDRSYQPRSKNALKTLCGFLLTHLDWVLAQPWVDEFAGEVFVLGAKAKAILEPTGNRKFTASIMRCVEITDEGERCDGNMWAFLTLDDPYADAKSTLVCDSCKHEVTSDAWMTYGRKVLATKESDALKCAS